MNNWELFDKYVNELIQQNDTYKLAILTYKKYLKEHDLSEQVFDIRGSDIDKYFDYLTYTCVGYCKCQYKSVQKVEYNNVQFLA